MTDPLEHLGEAAIEAIARRVAQLLRAPDVQGDGLLAAAQVAARLGVDRSWVYAHADELGAVRLGQGPRPRLRFDPAVVAHLMVGRRGPQPAPAIRAGAATPTQLLPIKAPTRSRARRTLG